jgi:O-antigen/teichoic acid export membrane protein
MNIYFGVVLNTARGIADQIDGAVKQFAQSFTTAVNPQITKGYAQNDFNRVYALVCKGAKFSYLLLLLMIVPIIVETEFILKIWLGNVPAITILFVRLTMFCAMVTTLGNTSYTACLATGDIKKYSIYVTLACCLVFVITWLLYAYKYTPESTYYVYFVVYTIVQLIRLFIMKIQINFPIRLFLTEVVGKITLVTILSFILPMVVKYMLQESFVRFISVFIASLLWTSILSYIFALDKEEKRFFKNKISGMLSKLIKS